MDWSDSELSEAAHLSLNQLAAASLRAQAEILKKHAAFAARTDGLHDARVALRRMRIAGSKKLRGRIDKLDRLLGRARDAEIAAEDATAYADKLAREKRQRFQAYLEELDLAREREFKTLRGELAEKRIAEVMSRARREAKRLEKEPPAARPRPAGLDAGAAVSKAYADLAAFEAPAIGGEADEELYHEIRRAAKRFRYTVELFEPILGPKSAALVGTAKFLQDLLGKLNDASICARAATERLSRWNDDREGPLPESYPEVAAYLAAKLRALKKREEAFPRAWRRIASPAFRKRMHAALGACPVDFVPAARFIEAENKPPELPDEERSGRSGS